MNVAPFADPLVIIVSRSEVEDQDTTLALSVLKRLVETPEVARANMERVDIAFDGYNETSEELFEIPEVRDFVHQLNEQFPFWLFYLSKHFLGLQSLMFCFLSPYLTEEAKAKTHADELLDLLLKCWLPAMNDICVFAGVDEDENDKLTQRALLYFKLGPLQIPYQE